MGTDGGLVVEVLPSVVPGLGCVVGSTGEGVTTTGGVVVVVGVVTGGVTGFDPTVPPGALAVEFEDDELLSTGPTE